MTGGEGNAGFSRPRKGRRSRQWLKEHDRERYEKMLVKERERSRKAYRLAKERDPEKYMRMRSECVARQKELVRKKRLDPAQLEELRRCNRERQKRWLDDMRTNRPEEYAAYLAKRNRRAAAARADPERHARILERRRALADAVRSDPERYAKHLDGLHARMDAIRADPERYAAYAERERRRCAERKNDPEERARRRKYYHDRWMRMIGEIRSDPEKLRAYHERCRAYYRGYVSDPGNREKLRGRVRNRILAALSGRSVTQYVEEAVRVGNVSAALAESFPEEVRAARLAETGAMRERDAEIASKRDRYRKVEEAMRLPPEERYRVAVGWTDDERDYAMFLESAETGGLDDELMYELCGGDGQCQTPVF